MNDLNLNFKALASGISANARIISLKLQNNNIDGRKNALDIVNMLKDHRSLTSLDFGNSEAIKNRNRINNDGLIAIGSAIYQSNFSLISELYL
jgi:hypothetical protein